MQDSCSPGLELSKSGSAEQIFWMNVRDQSGKGENKPETVIVESVQGIAHSDKRPNGILHFL